MLKRLRTGSYVLIGLATLGLLAMFAYTLLLSLQDGSFAHTAFVGLENWQRLFTSANFAALLRNSLLLGALLLGIIPLALCATAGLTAIQSVPLRFALWAVLALPLCLGQTELAHAVYNLFGIPFASGALARVPMVYALIVRDLPIIALVALLVDLRFRPGILRLWGFVAIVGFFWAFARGFALPMETAINLISPLSYETLDTLSFFAYRMGFLQMSMGIGAAAELFSQCIAVVLFVAMACVAWLVLPKEKADALAPSGLSGSAVALALPAAAFMLVPLIAWIARLPQMPPASNAPISALPTVAVMLGGLVAIPLGLLLAGAIDRGSRPAPLFAGVICAACGATLSLATYMIVRGLGMINTLVPMALLAMNPLPVALLVGLAAPVIERNGRGDAALWMCAAGAGLLALAFTLGANGFWSMLLCSDTRMLTMPALQRAGAMGAGGTVFSVLPAFALLPLAIGGVGTALMAMALRGKKA